MAPQPTPHTHQVPWLTPPAPLVLMCPPTQFVPSDQVSTVDRVRSSLHDSAERLRAQADLLDMTADDLDELPLVDVVENVTRASENTAEAMATALPL